jgi:hypothetical protein
LGAYPLTLRQVSVIIDGYRQKQFAGFRTSSLTSDVSEK